MSDQDFVYGVFKKSQVALEVVSELHQAGLATSDICVVGTPDDEFKYVSAKIDDPTAKYFIRFGIGGCIAGLIAGILGAPQLPVASTVQILAPLMGAISGGIVLAYFGVFMCAFLYANKPHHWSNVF